MGFYPGPNSVKKKMNQAKRYDSFEVWVAAFSLVVISLLLIVLLLVLGREMVVRLEAHVTQGINDFNLFQKEKMP